MRTRETRRVVYNTFTIICNGLTCLERRPWRILSHDGTIKQWLCRVEGHSLLILTSHLANHFTRVECWRGNHCQNLPCLWLNGYNSTQFSFHQTFSKCLQVSINSQLQVLSSFGLLVVLPLFIPSLDTSMGIAKQNLHSFLPTQRLLVLTFNAHLTDVVAWLIILIFLYIALTYLCHIAQNVSCNCSMVLTNATLLDIKTGKTIQLFLKGTKLFIAQLTYKQLLSKSRIARVLCSVLYISHTLNKELLCDI